MFRQNKMAIHLTTLLNSLKPEIAEAIKNYVADGAYLEEGIFLAELMHTDINKRLVLNYLTANECNALRIEYPGHFNALSGIYGLIALQPYDRLFTINDVKVSQISVSRLKLLCSHNGLAGLRSNVFSLTSICAIQNDACVRELLLNSNIQLLLAAKRQGILANVLNTISTITDVRDFSAALSRLVNARTDEAPEVSVPVRQALKK